MSPSALLSRLREEESGFSIIEVLVSALVVAVISIGVLKSLDTATARSGNQKARGVAAGLAQSDQERLRAFRPQDLNNYSETRCVQKRSSGFVDDPGCDDNPALGPSYEIISRTDWVSDQSGTRSCGTGARADYIRISSTVLWANPGDDAETGRNRVSMASLVAPRVGSFGDEGSLSIEIRDRNGNPRPSVAVSVEGPKDLSGTTDSAGCLFFGYLPQGNYTIDVAQTGNVDKDGNSVISQQFGVTNGSVTAAVIEYDVGARLNVTFQTRLQGFTWTSGEKADALSIAHSSLASPTWRGYASNEAGGRPEATFDLGTGYSPLLFPFTSSYGVYAGDCPGNQPSFYGLDPADGWPVSFTSAPVLTPGGTASMVVHQPAVRLTPGTGWPGGAISGTVRVLLKPETSFGGVPTGCATQRLYTAVDDPNSTGAWLLDFEEHAAGGLGFGVPVGAYDICVRYFDTSLNPDAWRYSNLNFSAPHALQPLDDGPTDTHADVTVNKPTGTSSC
jgi:type II secretory pathway pseudopilin PulG